MVPTSKRSLNPPPSRLTLRALICKASENKTKLRSDVKYEAVVPMEDERDPDTGVHSESSPAHNYSARDTSMPPSESASVNKESISSVDIKSELVTNTTTMIVGERKPHKMSENATALKSDLKHDVVIPANDTRDPVRRVRFVPFSTDTCLTRDTSVTHSESVSVVTSELDSLRSFALVGGSSSSLGSFALVEDSTSLVPVKSPLDLLGRLTDKLADILFDDESVESFYSSTVISCSDEIPLNHKGDFNRRYAGDKANDNNAAPLDIFVPTRKIKVQPYLQEFGSVSTAKVEDKTSFKSELSLSRTAEDASISTKKMVSSLLGLRPEKRLKHTSQRPQQRLPKGAAERMSREKSGKKPNVRKPLPSTEPRPKESTELKKVRQAGEDLSIPTKKNASKLLGLRPGKRLIHPSSRLQQRLLKEAAEQVPRQKSGKTRSTLKSLPSTESCFWD